MRRICVILARAGSKRLPRKNFKKLGDKLLIEYTIQAAIESCVFDVIIVSTDSSKIRYICRTKYDGDVWCMKRPRYLASDTANSEECVLHAVSEFEREAWIYLLQPTSPLRTAEDIRIVDMMMVKQQKSIVSVDETTDKVNGAIYCMKHEELLYKRKFDCELKYYMSHDRSIDIDTQLDFDIAQRIING